MKLRIALRLVDGEVVAFVGGGGKSSAMFRLAEEIVAAGGRVITTTTTRIFAAQIRLAPAHFPAREASRARLEEALAQHGHVLLTGPVDPQAGKASGVSSELIAELRTLPELSAILMEADGSRMRSFKAPAEHEPVIPLVTSLVIPVVGADVLGRPLTDEHVHRAARVAALAGASEGEIVTPAVAARVLAHPGGGLKGVPSAARVIPLINKVEDPAALEAARETARLLLVHPRLQAVALGAVKQAGNPVQEVHGRIAGVVLAAGRSTRMGRAKQTLPWRGSTVIAEVVHRARASGVDQVVVVTGAQRQEVERALDDEMRLPGPRVRLVYNPAYESDEMAGSLQVALRGLPPDCLAALVLLGDQPQLEPAVVQAVIQRWRETQAPAVAPFFQDRRGHPVLFDRTVWPGVLALSPQGNPRQVVQAVGALERVAVESDSVLRDLDTPEDYQREAGLV